MDCMHARLPCPSPTPRAPPTSHCSNSCSSSQWCHPTISSSVVPFSSCPQSFPASGSFPMSQFFASGGQSIGISASASVPPMIKPMPPALEGGVLTTGPPGKSQGAVLRLQACGHLWQWPQESNIPSWPISSLALLCPLTHHPLISWAGEVSWVGLIHTVPQLQGIWSKTWWLSVGKTPLWFPKGRPGPWPFPWWLLRTDELNCVLTEADGAELVLLARHPSFPPSSWPLNSSINPWFLFSSRSWTRETGQSRWADKTYSFPFI